VRDICPNVHFDLGVALACALVEPDRCRVILAPEADVKAFGLPIDLIMRHEIAHCNGWPGDHEGALLYEEWAKDLAFAPDVASQFDLFARNAVGKTVAEVARSFAAVPPDDTLFGGGLGRVIRFVDASKGIGLGPQSQLTGERLRDLAMAMPLAKSIGIGADLSDEQWREAHAFAFQASKARQERAASGPDPKTTKVKTTKETPPPLRNMAGESVEREYERLPSRHCGIAVLKPCE
jgi:hypothetical protein